LRERCRAQRGGEGWSYIGEGPSPVLRTTSPRKRGEVKHAFPSPHPVYPSGHCQRTGNRACGPASGVMGTWQKPHALPRRHLLMALWEPTPDQALVPVSGRCWRARRSNRTRDTGRRGLVTRSGERAFAPAISTYPCLSRSRGALFPAAAPVPLIRTPRSRPLRYRAGRSNPAFPERRVRGSMAQAKAVWIK
jgi:hypothetical protein